MYFTKIPVTETGFFVGGEGGERGVGGGGAVLHHFALFFLILNAVGKKLLSCFCRHCDRSR